MTTGKERRPAGNGAATSKGSDRDSDQPTLSRAESAWCATPIPMSDREIAVAERPIEVAP